MENRSTPHIVIDNNFSSLRSLQDKKVDNSFYTFTRDMNKCINCHKCVKACGDLQGIFVFQVQEDGTVGIKEENMAATQCISCGQCIKVCPTGALEEKSNISLLEEQLKNPNKHVIAQISPSLKHTLGEEFGIATGVDISPKIVSALKEIGFSKVFSTGFASDVNIIETSADLKKRLDENGPFPVFTSTCTGWINYAEKFCPEFLGHLSPCKSPQQILGSLSKSYYEETIDVSSENIFSVAMMPCIAKKDEANRFDMKDENGNKDVDLVLTIKEVAHLLKQKGIDLGDYDKTGSFDKPMESDTGSSRIKSVTGGLAEAMLRNLAHMMGEKSFPSGLDGLRGTDGIKIANVLLGEKKLNIAVVNGIKNVPVILDIIKDGITEFHLIEVMACPGGCIGGGGIPLSKDPDIIKKRTESIYSYDLFNDVRCSWENPDVKTLYSQYLKEPLGEESQRLFHFHYKNRRTRKYF